MFQVELFNDCHPAFAHLARDSHLPRDSKHEDWTSVAIDHRADCNAPYDIAFREQVNGWRQRLAAGDEDPRWGLYGEWIIELPDGSFVSAIYEPHRDSKGNSRGSGWSVEHLEFHGPVSSTGYQSHFFQRPKRPLAKYILDTAVEYHTKAIAEWEAAHRRSNPTKRRSRA